MTHEAIDKTWNPTKPVIDYETFSLWQRHNCDVAGKVALVKAGERVVAVQEANMGGVYWRLLWPKDAAAPGGQWFQDVHSSMLGPKRSAAANNKMSSLAEGDRICVENIPFIAHPRIGQKFCIDLERAPMEVKQ